MDVVLIGMWIQRWLCRNDDDVETKALKTVLQDAGERIDPMDPALQAIRDRFESASPELLSALSLQACDFSRSHVYRSDRWFQMELSKIKNAQINGLVAENERFLNSRSLLEDGKAPGFEKTASDFARQRF